MNQKETLNVIKSGKSVYLGGEPGTGKTHLLCDFISYMKRNDIPHGVTASTGIAATHLDGRTIHSFSGIGIKEKLTKKNLQDISKDKRIKKKIQRIRVIIIDEVSMLSGEFIDMLDEVLRYINGSMEPFGGIQMIFAGDFFQLPPIKGNTSYAFESSAWKRLNPVACYLTKQYRQKDEKLIKILLNIRRGVVDEKTLKALKERVGILPENKKITQIFTHNIDVDRINRKELDKLKGKEEVFLAKVKGISYHTDSMLASSIIPGLLRLKEGAEVMFIKNDPKGKYVNGTRGTVISLRGGEPVVETNFGVKITAEPQTWKREEDGVVLGEVSQIPLRLAWAVTVHKSQGVTLDEALIDLSSCFVPGQGYVALSRVSTLEGLYLKGFNKISLEVDEKVRKIDFLFNKKI